MTEQNISDWIKQEQEELGTQEERVFEKLPALKLQENKVTEIVVDFSKKFEKYETTNMKNEKVTKAIIPVTLAGVKHNFWLNKKNPVYRELLKLGEGKTSVTVKIMQTGNKENTKYILVG